MKNMNINKKIHYDGPLHSKKKNEITHNLIGSDEWAIRSQAIRRAGKTSERLIC